MDNGAGGLSFRLLVKHLDALELCIGRNMEACEVNANTPCGGCVVIIIFAVADVSCYTLH